MAFGLHKFLRAAHGLCARLIASLTAKVVQVEYKSKIYFDFVEAPPTLAGGNGVRYSRIINALWSRIKKGQTFLILKIVCTFAVHEK